MDRNQAKIIVAWIRKNLENTTDPRQHGKGLTGNKSGNGAIELETIEYWLIFVILKLKSRYSQLDIEVQYIKDNRFWNEVEFRKSMYNLLNFA